MPDPTVSVVVPALNRAPFLSATLDSILAQDQEYPAIECVVVDGGSTDGSQDLLAGYGARIRWWSEPDSGPYDAINRGWARARGEVLAWLNADDTYAPGAIARAVRCLAANPRAGVVYGDCLTVGLDGRPRYLKPAVPWLLERALLRGDFPIGQPAAFIRRTVVEQIGGLRRSHVHDLDLWLRASLAGVAFQPFAGLAARAVDHPGRISARPEVMVPAVVEAVEAALADPACPLGTSAERRRALSNAWSHGLYFAGQGEWRWAWRCAREAVAADPTNGPAVLARFAENAGPRRVAAVAGALGLGSLALRRAGCR